MTTELGRSPQTDSPSTILKRKIGRWIQGNMDRKSLSLLSSNFKAYIMPLLNEGDPDDYHVIWEFQKLFHAKRLEIMAAESRGARNRKGSSLDSNQLLAKS